MQSSFWTASGPGPRAPELPRVTRVVVLILYLLWITAFICCPSSSYINVPITIIAYLTQSNALLCVYCIVCDIVFSSVIASIVRCSIIL